MSDTDNHAAPDHEDTAEAEGGSGMPMTATEAHDDADADMEDDDALDDEADESSEDEQDDAVVTTDEATDNATA